MFNAYARIQFPAPLRRPDTPPSKAEESGGRGRRGKQSRSPSPVKRASKGGRKKQKKKKSSSSSRRDSRGSSR